MDRSSNWFTFSWSPWTRLRPEYTGFSQIPDEQGIYRIRHREREPLVYIGESGNLQRRVRTVLREAHREKMPYTDPHTAAPCLWAIQNEDGSQFEVSWTVTPTISKYWRKGIEASLISLYRRETGQSPLASFGRILPEYEKSTARQSGIRGGPSDDAPSAQPEHLAPYRWTNFDRVTSKTWMGYHWSETYRLKDYDRAPKLGSGVYRIWRNESRPLLSYIGESTDLPNRLEAHIEKFGKAARFDMTTRSELSDSLGVTGKETEIMRERTARRREIENDLIAAHYLTYREPPYAQFRSKNYCVDLAVQEG